MSYQIERLGAENQGDSARVGARAGRARAEGLRLRRGEAQESFGAAIAAGAPAF